MNNILTTSNNCSFGYESANIGSTLSNISSFGFQSLRDTLISGGCSFGYQSAYQNQTGNHISVFGYQSAGQNITGDGITSFGYLSCNSGITNNYNTGFGDEVLNGGSTTTITSQYKFTNIASGSNGQTLPQSVINVNNTAGFPTSGFILVTTSAGRELVTYTGTTATSFTGCAGGTGTMSTNGAVDTRAFANGTILTLPYMTSQVVIGMYVAHSNFAAGTIITEQLSGTPNLSGTYRINNSQSYISTDLNLKINAVTAKTTSATCVLTNVLTINNAPTGSFVPGMYINTVGVSGLYIVKQLTGSSGGVGTYRLSDSTYNFTGVEIQGVLIAEKNTGVGYNTLKINQGTDNSADGNLSLSLNTTGSYNSAKGSESLKSNTTGSHNTASGFKAGFNNTTGNENVIYGSLADTNGTVSGAVAIGSESYVDVENGMAMGKGSTTNSVANSLALGLNSSPNDTSHALAISMNSSSVLPGSLGCTINSGSYQLPLYSSLFNSTATSGGTTNLSVSSGQTQFFTGTSSQTVILPDVGTLSLGFNFKIVNRSTGTLTIQAFGGVATTISISTLTWGYLTYYSSSGNSQASWSYESGGSVV